MKPFLSIVVPVYNEEQSIPVLYQRLVNSCEPLEVPYEIVFVDDGSSDQTFTILESLHRQDGRVKVLRFRKNYGQTAAMAAGFRVVRGTVVISMDGDLQNDPADIPAFLHKLAEGYDVVCGWRKDRKDKFLARRLPSIIANWTIGKITGLPIHDNGCSLKAYRAQVIKRVALYADLHRFIPVMSTLTGARVAEIVVRHHARQFGQSKYGLSRAWRVFLDLFVIKMLTGFAERPALWFAFWSLPAAFLGTLSALGLLVTGTDDIIFPSLVFLFFALAGHLLFLGFLGETILQTGDFRPGIMIAKITIRETGTSAIGIDPVKTSLKHF